jgi:hypothetical protein
LYYSLPMGTCCRLLCKVILFFTMHPGPACVLSSLGLYKGYKSKRVPIKIIQIVHSIILAFAEL